MSLYLVLILLAFLSEVAGALGVPGRVNFTALGLALYFLTMLIGGAR